MSLKYAQVKNENIENYATLEYSTKSFIQIIITRESLAVFTVVSFS